MSQRARMMQVTSPAVLPAVAPATRRAIRRVIVIRRWFRLPQEAFARVLGVSRSTVARWEADGSGPEPDSAEGRWLGVLAEIKRLGEHLWRNDPKEAQRWLYTSIPFFHGKRPIDILKSEGPLRVLFVLRAEQEGGYT